MLCVEIAVDNQVFRGIIKMCGENLSFAAYYIKDDAG
jgi:hypothetical protein